jgi:hypothetical protein
MPRNLSKRT